MSGHIGQARIGEKDEEIISPDKKNWTSRRGYMAVASEHH